MLITIKKILKGIIITISIFIILINITLIVKSETNKNKVPDFLGFTPFIIVSGSMEPNIKTDNVIITKKINQEDIKVGDIISYKDIENNIIITHRVTNIVNQDGQTFYETKGDNNALKDKNLVSASQIQGKYLFTIPIIGKVISYVKTPSGMGLVLTFIICIYVLYDIAAREYMKKKYKARISQ